MARDPWAYSSTERDSNENIRRIGRGVRAAREHISPEQGYEDYVREPARETARAAARKAGGYRKSRKSSARK